MFVLLWFPNHKFVVLKCVSASLRKWPAMSLGGLQTTRNPPVTLLHVFISLSLFRSASNSTPMLANCHNTLEKSLISPLKQSVTRLLYSSLKDQLVTKMGCDPQCFISESNIHIPNWYTRTTAPSAFLNPNPKGDEQRHNAQVKCTHISHNNDQFREGTTVRQLSGFH